VFHSNLGEHVTCDHVGTRLVSVSKKNPRSACSQKKNGSNLVAILAFSTKHPDAKVQEAEQLEKGLQLLDIRETARSFYAQPPIGKVLAEFFRLKCYTGLL
jgi:hypothetical protein